MVGRRLSADSSASGSERSSPYRCGVVRRCPRADPAKRDMCPSDRTVDGRTWKPARGRNSDGFGRSAGPAIKPAQMFMAAKAALASRRSGRATCSLSVAAYLASREHLTCPQLSAARRHPGPCRGGGPPLDNPARAVHARAALSESALSLRGVVLRGWSPSVHPHQLLSRLVAAAAVLATVLAGSAGVASTATAKPPAAVPDFGPNVTIFDPSMPTAQIRRRSTPSGNSSGTTRWAPTGTRCTSCPGVYGTVDDPLQVKVGYYTEVAGLGATPGDVRITGKIESATGASTDGQPT